MRRLSLILIAAIAVMAIVGCGGDAAVATAYAPNQSVEAYSYVHGGYVGRATATTDGEGNVEYILDEAFLPHTLASADLESDEWNEDNTAFYQVRGEVNHVARWVSYNDTMYVGDTVGTTLVYVPANDQGEPATDVNKDHLELSILDSESSMAAYWESIQDGGFAVYTEWGGDPQTVTTTNYGSLTKRGSEYWNFGLGWQGNMDAIQEAAVENGVSFSLDEMERTDDGWQLADATTSATASDFPDYFKLIQLAEARLDVQAAEE
jgi:hypothetical protein